MSSNDVDLELKLSLVNIVLYAMSKREKLRERLKNNPTDATFADIRKLLEQEGFVLDRVTGSHHIFVRNEIILPIPVHNNKVKTVYTKRVIEIIEPAESQQQEEKDQS